MTKKQKCKLDTNLSNAIAASVHAACYEVVDAIYKELKRRFLDHPYDIEGVLDTGHGMSMNCITKSPKIWCHASWR
jgi:hypothetical protein